MKLYRSFDKITCNYKSDLFCAIIRRDVELVERTLAANPATILYRDSATGVSALHLAVYSGDPALIRLVFDAPGADPQLRDRFGRRPVDLCRYAQNHAVVRLVIERTYKEALRDLEGQTPPACRLG